MAVPRPSRNRHSDGRTSLRRRDFLEKPISPNKCDVGLRAKNGKGISAMLSAARGNFAGQARMKSRDATRHGISLWLWDSLPFRAHAPLATTTAAWKGRNVPKRIAHLWLLDSWGDNEHDHGGPENAAHNGISGRQPGCFNDRVVRSTKAKK